MDLGPMNIDLTFRYVIVYVKHVINIQIFIISHCTQHLYYMIVRLRAPI